MIEYVLLDNERIDIGASRFPFVDYFSVDSLSLLIGRNGSGKTRILTGIAEALTSGPEWSDRIATSHIDSNGMRIEEELDHASSARGVVYYTSFPFRRKIRKAPTLIDASMLGTKLRDSAKMRLFKSIARALDPNAYLSVTAFVSYPASTIQRTIYEALLAPDMTLLDYGQNMNLRRIRELKAMLPARSPSSEGRDVEAEAASIQGLRAEIRACESRLFDYLIQWADDSNGPRLERLSWLASLTKELSTKNSGAQITVRAVLNELGLVALPERLVNGRGFERVSAVANQTLLVLNYLSPAVLIDDYEREVSFQIDDDTIYEFVCKGKTAIEFRWENLSSGLLAIVEQFATIDIAMKRLKEKGCSAAILLLDEPDAFLHLEWQRRYIDLLNNFLAERKHDFDCVQVMLATHSPIIAADLPSAMVQSLDGKHGFKTFAAPIDDLIYQSFDSNSMGVYASKKIRELHQAALNRRLSHRDRALIEQIADEGLQYAILNPTEN